MKGKIWLPDLYMGSLLRMEWGIKIGFQEFNFIIPFFNWRTEGAWGIFILIGWSFIGLGMGEFEK